MKSLQPLVFVGASTAFAEISEIIADINRVERQYEMVAMLDDNPKLHGQKLGGVQVTGGLDTSDRYPDAQFVFGIGSYRTRLMRYAILQRLNLPDERFVTLVHPTAKVYPSARIGAGCIVHSGVVIGNDAVLEPFSIVTFNAILGPYVRLGRCAMVTTMALALSYVQIGPCAFVGVKSCLAEGIRVGPGAMVGMASAVFRNVAPGAFVLGNPAQLVNQVKVPPEILQGWEASSGSR